MFPSDHKPADLQSAVQRAALGIELLFKPMFGGILGYAQGKPFASLSNVGLALKLAEADRVELLALPGARALRYEPDQPPSKTYVVVPESMLDEPDTLLVWIERSIAFVTKQDGSAKKKPASKRRP